MCFLRNAAWQYARCKATETGPKVGLLWGMQEAQSSLVQ